MKYVVTASQMKQVDQNTSDIIGIPSLVLMERAGSACVQHIMQDYPQKIGGKVAIICGNGNNGGDGFVIGRILHEYGYKIQFFMVKDYTSYSENNLAQQKIVKELDMAVTVGLPKEGYDIYIDAILGTGAYRELDPFFQDYLYQLNRMSGIKIAIDLPTGVHPDNGSVCDNAFIADCTYTFAYKKYAHMIYPAKTNCGKVTLLKIGIVDDAFQNQFPQTYYLDIDEYKQFLPKRVPFSHKGTYKKAGIVAGCQTMAGAAILASESCLRMGVGYTKLVSDSQNKEIILGRVPEVLYADFEKSYEHIADCRCVLIGPGLSCTNQSYELLSYLFDKLECTLILDADALNLIAKHEDLEQKMHQYAASHMVVLTPHQKELQRILHDEEIDEYVSKHKVYIVSKDAVSIIYAPDGRKVINTSGDNGMSTAGSGDVLAGMLCGLCAQHDFSTVDPLHVIATGVFLHGKCGEYCAKETCSYVTIASDLSKAIQYVL